MNERVNDDDEEWRGYRLMPLPAKRPPEALTSLPHWVAWRYEARNGGKPTKVPYNLATGHLASSTDPSTWIPFSAIDELPAGYDGLGFVLTGSGMVGVDFDDVLTDAGTVKPCVAQGLAAFTGHYGEISPSGTGIKFWVRGSLPGRGRKVWFTSENKRTKEGSADASWAFEIYDAGRYFTVTGQRWEGCGEEVREDQALIDKAYAALDGQPAPRAASQPLGDITEGGRHEFLRSQAAHLRNIGAGRSAILAALREINQERCKPPKPDDELVGLADYFARADSDPAFAPRGRKQANGPDIPQPGPEPITEDPIATAEGLISDAIAKADATAIFSDPLIIALARAGSVKQHDAKRRLEKAFPKDFPGNIRHWQSLIKTAEAQERAARYTAAEGWERELVRKPAREDGSPGPIQLCEANAILYFENHPDWSGVLGYNEFTAQHAVLREPPSVVRLKPGQFLEDHHDTQFARWLQVHTQQPWRVEMVRRAVDCWARDHSFHPVRDYLDACPPWKPGDPERLKTWLFDYAGAGPRDTDEEPDQALTDFIAAAGEKWMISAVARIRNPGCEVHHMLVLEGGEGLGKSTLVKKIGRGWSQVMTGSLDGRSAQELIASAVWIWEFSELASLKKTAEVESAKAFITKPEETFRPAYGHRVIQHKRECAFIATVNGDQYLDSSAWEDGKRRVWPIRCSRDFDTEGLEAVIDLLWAEADYKFKHGYRWHFDRNKDAVLIGTARSEQAARVPEHVLSSTFVRTAILVCEKQPDPAFYGSASVSEILAEAGVPIDRRRGLQQDVGRCLKAAGWKIHQPRATVKTELYEKGEQVRRWRNFERYPI